ncbi:PadR family transcriptional regulator [Gordonibacter sp. An230]|uniref:PadR family transcriptional regulator n=1 Tax=Gordonibacter sp. An230 TaxID=1965592 RepID=UPI001EF60B0D|nr:PadR family transcriptional regulator [Gordonibacter sp. An230]
MRTTLDDGSEFAASCGSSVPDGGPALPASVPAVRRPCCRRRGGGGGALVEPAALAALLYAGGYGYDMRKTILEKTGGAVDVDVGGLYRSLRRLEEEGAVVSRWCDDESGPRRREYELTHQGVELAEQWLDALRDRQRLDELLVGLLEGGLKTLQDASMPRESRISDAGDDSADPDGGFGGT